MSRTQQSFKALVSKFEVERAIPFSHA